MLAAIRLYALQALLTKLTAGDFRANEDVTGCIAE